METPYLAMGLQERLEKKAREKGGQYFGVADLEPVRDFVAEWGGELFTHFPRAISMGVRLVDAIVDESCQDDNPYSAINYWYHCYYAVDPLLDQLGLEIGTMLDKEGHRAYIIPAPSMVKGIYSLERERDTGTFSHKLAAHLAGLGWIGKNANLITPESGPRVRWITVLTDALLEAGEPLENRCGNCKACVNNCPANAFTGASFDKPKPRHEIFDVQKCWDYQEQILRKLGVRMCAKCVCICSYGRKNKSGEVVRRKREMH